MNLNYGSLKNFITSMKVTSQEVATGREDFPTYNKKRKDVGWSRLAGFPTENVIEKLRMKTEKREHGRTMTGDDGGLRWKRAYRR